MYCRECGKKNSKNNVYCGNCGAKLVQEKNDKTMNNNSNSTTSNLLLLLSFICLFGAFIINIFILPLAIFGIIMSIKYSEKTCLIINILSFILGIVVFVSWFVLIFGLVFNIGSKVEKGIENYYDEFKENEKDYHYDKYKNTEIDIAGTWYLYSNDKIDDSTYYKFNADNSFTYYVDNNIYIGTYSIEKNNMFQDNDGDSYKLTLDVITIIKNDKTIVDSNIDDFSYNIELEKETMNVTDLSDNSNFVLKKDAKMFY